MIDKMVVKPFVFAKNSFLIKAKGNRHGLASGITGGAMDFNPIEFEVLESEIADCRLVQETSLNLAPFE